MHFSDLTALTAELSTVSPDLARDVAAIEGDITIIGAGGKLGPSLVELACRAREETGTSGNVLAVSRFSTPGEAERLEAAGATVIRADIADDRQLAGLPDSPHVIFLVGSKFGTTGSEASTWLTNSYLPGRVVERFAGSRTVALSTGNVYPLAPVQGGGWSEDDPVGPIGEYAMSCLGRERVMAGIAERTGTPLAILRLNYAVEMRYGVLADLATTIAAGRPVDLSMGYVNLIWQGFCNEVILRSLLHASIPPFLLNLTGPEVLAVRELAVRLAARIGRTVDFVSAEADTALLSDASRCRALFGTSAVDLDDLIDATADWVSRGGASLGKPTHFQTRDGRF